MAKLHRYEAIIKSSLNGATDYKLDVIPFLSKCDDLTKVEAAAMIQANTNAAINGSGKKYHIVCTDLRKLT